MKNWRKMLVDIGGYDNELVGVPSGGVKEMVEEIESLREQLALAFEAGRVAEREECISIVESYKVSVGNSRAGELACEWTMENLREIRDAIRARSTKVP